MKACFYNHLPVFAAAMATLSLASPAWAAPNDAAEFPHVIVVDQGATEFFPGDNIVISSLRGDRPHLEVGGRYLLEGTYTLASLEKAKLFWSITTRGRSGSTPVAAEERMTVSRGSGNFRLVKTFRADGWPHISFYSLDSGPARGGVYFGEQGVESTVLRRKSWSDVYSRIGPSQPLGSFNVGAAAETSGGNAAIMAFLGDPIPIPADLDARYGPAGLTAAFQQLSKTAGYDVKKFAVDTAEFPCLVYGVLAGKQDYRDMRQVLEAMNGYAYGGSVTGTMANGDSFFALNMTPPSQFPRGQVLTARRRMMIRLEMLASRAQQME